MNLKIDEINQQITDGSGNLVTYDDLQDAIKRAHALGYIAGVIDGSKRIDESSIDRNCGESR